MKQITLEIGVETPQGFRPDIITIGSLSENFIASEHYLCQPVSISLDENKAQLVIHSEEDTIITRKNHARYEVFLNLEEISIPESGSEFYELKTGDIFSFTETSGKHVKTVSAKVFSIYN